MFHNLGEGALLVSVVLFVFLLSLRASLVVAARRWLARRRRGVTGS